MFPRRKRLSRAAFPGVLAHGRRLSSPHFTAVLSHEEPGYAVVVSKKVARLSVTRHRLKRRVTAILRTLALPPGIIVFPKASASSVSYEAMQDELRKLLT